MPEHNPFFFWFFFFSFAQGISDSGVTLSTPLAVCAGCHSPSPFSFNSFQQFCLAKHNVPVSLHFSLSALNIFRKILLCYTVSQRSSGLWPEPTVQIVHKKKLFFSIVKYTNFWKWFAFYFVQCFCSMIFVSFKALCQLLCCYMCIVKTALESSSKAALFSSLWKYQRFSQQHGC